MAAVSSWSVRSWKIFVVAGIVLLLGAGAVLIFKMGARNGSNPEEATARNAGQKVFKDLQFSHRLTRITRSEKAEVEGEAVLRSRIKGLLDQPYSTERQKELTEICEKLSKEVGIKLAAEIVSGLSGPGKNRNWLLAGVVAGANEDLKSVVSVIRGMEYADDQDGCLNGLSNYLAKNACSIDSILTCAPFDKNEVESVLYGLTFRASRFGNDSDLIGNINTGVDDVKLLLEKSGLTKEQNVELLGLYLNNLSGLYPIESLDVAARSLGNYDNSTRETYDRVLGEAFRSDPKAAIETLERLFSQGAFSNSPKLIESALKRWMKYDQQAAVDWFSRSGKLGDVVKSHAAMPFLQQAINSQDVSAARNWADQISDPNLKKEAEGQVWSLERGIVRGEASKDPAALMKSIVAGESSHQEYWMEEVFATWMAKEPTKAQDWYQKNWNTMPASKSQYLAAAFANQAINQGDADTARQWAAHIEDAKTKQRIEAGIVKAETKNSQ